MPQRSHTTILNAERAVQKTLKEWDDNLSNLHGLQMSCVFVTRRDGELVCSISTELTSEARADHGA